MPTFTRRQFLTCIANRSLALSLLSLKPVFASSRRAKANIIIGGGGIGGTSAARTLAQLAPHHNITLIDPSSTVTSCVGSNLVLSGNQPFSSIQHTRRHLGSIQHIRATIEAIDHDHRSVFLSNGSKLSYDRLILSPGIDFIWSGIDGYNELISEIHPHAWRAGPQTLMLRKQIAEMPKQGTVILSVPDNPYRCPPGPYERASLIADYFTRHKMRAKIIIIDAKTKFSKQAGFERAWSELYPNMIEWHSSETEGRLEYIDARKKKIGTEFNRYRGDVLNIIPAQKASELTQRAHLTDASGWCPVDPQNFASTLIPNVFVIGDAASVSPMPKSAFSAHTQAQVCAVSVLNDLEGFKSSNQPMINHCYSFLSENQAISITGVYAYDADAHVLKTRSIGESTNTDDWTKEADFAKSWYGTFMREVFG